MKRKKDSKEKYKSYLESPWWKAIRLRILQRDRYTCQVCGNRELLVVHHLNYLRVGNERLSDLVTWCRDCHNGHHEASWLDIVSHRPMGIATKPTVELQPRPHAKPKRLRRKAPRMSYQLAKHLKEQRAFEARAAEDREWRKMGG